MRDEITNSDERLREGEGIRVRRSTIATLTIAAGWIVAVSYLCFATLLGVIIPYHDYDALALSGWSRLIAETGELSFPAHGAWYFHRPLFYVLQGWLWRLTGVHEASGRLLALAFIIGLALAVAMLARAGQKTMLATSLSVLLLLTLPAVANGAISGVTDVPVAALVAGTAAFLWASDPRRWWRVPAIALCAAAAGLTKPSAFPSLVGLAVAHAMGPRANLRDRLSTGVGPIAVGAALALGWDAYQARALGLPLDDFLRTGTTGYYADLAAAHRMGAVLRVDWLGPLLSGLLACGLIYAVLRVAGLAHRRATIVSAPVAMVTVWAGAWTAGGWGSVWVGPLASVGAVSATAALVGPMMLTSRPGQTSPPPRLQLARLLVWAAPPVVAWAVVTPYDTRLLSAAWPPLILLMTTVVTAALTAERRAPAQLVLSVGLVCLAISNGRGLDQGVGWTHLRQMWSAGLDANVIRRGVLGQLDVTREIVEREIGRDGRVYSSDGRLSFFFPGRHTSQYPQRCSDLEGHRVLVLMTDAITRTVQQRLLDAPADPRFWAGCRQPVLTEIARVGDFVIFRIEPPMSPQP